MQRHQHFVFALAATLTARALAQDLPPTEESLAAYADTTHSVTLADGREIHFVCMGAGSPTVILTAGLGGWAATWKEIQPTLARTTRLRLGPPGSRPKRRELGPSDRGYDDG